MTRQTARCLILACGNTLREDDGIGPFLASWSEERFGELAGVRAIASQQWAPELCHEIAGAETVLFIDCSLGAVPGTVAVTPVMAADEMPHLMTHHLDASSLLALARVYYDASPRCARMLSIGALSLELREGFSDAVHAALPEARRALEKTVLELLDIADQRR